MCKLKNIDLSFLIGESIIQICFGKYITQFFIGENINISSGDEIIVTYLDKKLIYSQDKETVDIPIKQLIGKTIIKIDVEENKNLIILLNDGIILSFISTDDTSESYSINYELGTIVV